jgi:hypothetical protein
MTATFASSKPHNAAFLVYINGIEVPAIRVSRRFGVWQIPELQVTMVPDPVLTRLGYEDRVQIEVFYLDDTSVDPSVPPLFRLYFDGEITGWGYQSTSAGRVISFTAVNQVAIFTQLMVQFLTTFDDLLGHASQPGAGATGVGVPSSQIVFPFSLFKQGLIPGQQGSPTSTLSQDSSTITRPFDFLYNVVRNMIGAQVPAEQQTIPAANFFARWSRLTNFHNRFAASPFFDEIIDNPNIFPVLRALQNVSAVETIARNLIPNVQNAGSIWDMVQLVFQTMLMEVAMIPSMPLVTVNLVSSLVLQTNFTEHQLSFDPTFSPNGAYVSKLNKDSRKLTPKRIPSYFPKPQMLFSIPPSCNVVFPSQLKTMQYEESYASQPTRLYFNDETLLNLLKIPRGGYRDTVHNALTIAYPPEADAASHARLEGGAKFNGKNFLLWPEEFFKGPVLDRRDVPPWLFFLKQNELQNAPKTGKSADGQVQTPSAPAQTAQVKPPTPATVPAGTMALTTGNVGVQAPNGARVFDQAVENLRSKVESLARASGLPTDFLLAWISHESGGQLTVVTKLNERGYFQIMGPHTERNSQGQLTAKTLTQVEAGQIGLTIADTGTGAGTPDSKPTDVGRLTTDGDFSLQAGVKLVQFYNRTATTFAQNQGLAWTTGDMMRLTKLMHNGVGSASTLMANAKAALGGATPTSWEAFYKAARPGLSAGFVAVLDNATAVGGVVAGATGVMTTKSDPRALAAPSVRPAPRGPSDTAATSTPPPAAPAAPVLDDATIAQFPETETVYQLYAKFEFFRERYARRSGSAQLAWNPYIVPGFPAMIFDHRSSRVDLACYITTVQDQIDAQGSKNTTISFLYGRQLQEMFDLMAEQFAQGEASSGSAPAEPIREVRKIVQSFPQAEEYYRRLFFGGQQLFGKDASFDFRKIIGYAPEVPNAGPTVIFVDGPEEAAQDDYAGAATQLQQLLKDRGDKSSQVIAGDANQKTLLALMAKTPQDNEYSKAVYDNLQSKLSEVANALAVLRKQLVELDAKVNKLLAIVQSTQDVTKTSQVTHNLVGNRELVPLPATEPLFASYDAAMRYAWRPICTLDEYIVFHESAGEGLIAAHGNKASLGAPYYERIRRFTPAVNADLSPIGADGLGIIPVNTAKQVAATQGATNPATGQPTQPAATVSVAPGLSNTNFPQTRADWDKALLAYRTNVRTVKAPRT